MQCKLLQRFVRFREAHLKTRKICRRISQVLGRMTPEIEIFESNYLIDGVLYKLTIKKVNCCRKWTD